MIQINTKDGRTLNFDITLKPKLDEFKNLVDDVNFASKISGVGILYKGAHHIFPMPKEMEVINFHAETLIEPDKKGVISLTGERLTCYTEGLRITLTVWYQKFGPRVATYEIKKIGRRVFKPNGKEVEE
jgi:hypothetical protein